MRINITLGLLGILIVSIFAIVWTKYGETKPLESKIASYLRQYDKLPTGSPKASDRNFWEQVPKKVEKMSPDENLTPLEVVRIGTLQECCYFSGEWIDAIEKSISRLLEESWASKANAQEIADKAAIISHCIGTLEEKINPSITERVKDKVKNEVLTSYWNIQKNVQEEEMAGVVERKTPKVLSPKYLLDILTCGLITEQKLETKANLVSSIMKNLDYYNETVEPSGYIPGGIIQYNKEIGSYITAIERILLATGGEINLYNDEKVEKMLEFPADLSFPTKNPDLPIYFPVFGGNSNPSGIEPIILDILNERFASPPSQIIEYKNNSPITGTIFSVYAACKNVKTAKEPLALTNASKKDFSSKDKNLTIIYNTSKDMVLASMGNSINNINKTQENGAYSIFSLSNDELAWEFVIGQPNKTKQDKTPNKSIGLPIIGEIAQSEVPDYEKRKKTLISNVYDSENFSHIQYELKDSYAIEGLKSLSRSIKFDKKGNAVIVTDKFEATTPMSFETPIITHNVPTKISDFLALSSGDNSYKLEIIASSPHTMEQNILDDSDTARVVETKIKLQEKKDKGYIKYRVSKVGSQWQDPPYPNQIREQATGEEILDLTKKTDIPGQYTILKKYRGKGLPLLGNMGKNNLGQETGILSTIGGQSPNSPYLRTPTKFKDIDVSQKLEYNLSDTYDYPVLGVRRLIAYSILGDLQVVEAYEVAAPTNIVLEIPTRLKILNIRGNALTLKDTENNKIYILYASPIDGISELRIRSKGLSKSTQVIEIEFEVDKKGLIAYKLIEKKQYENIIKRAK